MLSESSSVEAKFTDEFGRRLRALSKKGSGKQIVIFNVQSLVG